MHHRRVLLQAAAGYNLLKAFTMPDQPQDIFQDVEPAADAQSVRRAVPVTPTTPVVVPAPRAASVQVRRARWPLLMGGAIILLLGIAAAVVLLRKSPAPTVENVNSQNANVTVNSSAATNEQVTPIVVSPEVITNDTDRDGLTDAEEQAQGTKETVTDTDGDGLSDADEVRVYKTNPLKPDSDADGNADGAEVEKGYNPNGPGMLLNFETERQKLPK